MSVRILASASPGEVRVAALDADGMLDFAIWRPGAPDGVGDLHRGRIVARVPAMAGAFVDIEGADGFLPDSDGGATTTEGTVLGVRITRASQGGKGPRLSARLDVDEQHLVGSGPPALVRRGPNAVERLAALHADAPVIVDDSALAALLRPSLGGRLTIARAVFDDAIAGQIEALVEPAAMLAGGARMTVHPTPAVCAIDVDLGALTARREGKASMQLAANKALLPELARQIRLRNLGGPIVVDVAGLSAKRRAALGPDFAAALSPDPLHPRFLGFSALGLAEILRPRVYPPLHELLAGPHAAGLAALRCVAQEVAARPDRMPVLRAAPDVAARLRADTLALADLARLAGRPLILSTDPALAPVGWSLEEPHG